MRQTIQPRLRLRRAARLARMAGAALLAPLAHSQNAPPYNPANEAVLQQWANQTGQAAQVVQGEQGAQLEWHGQATLDVYSNSVSTQSGNPSLSPLRGGTFERLSVGNDLRSTGRLGDVNYFQAVGTQSTDRSVLSRYNPQMFSFQAGRAGPGYQIAGGDVVANYSGLGANMGLRGLSAARQMDALVVSGFAGTVAESWESLFNASTLTGQPARVSYLRDVYGAKLDYQATPEWLLFSTLQSGRERKGSATVVPGAVASDPRSSAAFTAGGRYQTQWAADRSLTVGAEVGRSRAENLTSRESASDSAVLVDATARVGLMGLRAGFHRLGDRWASVGQTAAPGIRESYGGGDWQFAPEWVWGLDGRQTTNRQTFAGVVQQSELDSLTNRISWSPSAWTGWNFSWSDLRNRTTDSTGTRGDNNSWQVSVLRSVTPWSASLTLGRSVQRFEGRPASDSRSNQWQLSAGRSWSNDTAETPASLTFNLQLFLGLQNQLLAIPASNRAATAGLSASLLAGSWGSVNGNWQLQSIDPKNGTPKLISRQLSLDYSRQLTEQWSMKAYLRNIERNQGSLLAYVRERIFGLQAGYLW